MTDLKKLKLKLDEQVKKYETPEFILSDPISIPHRFSKQEDIEIAALFSATIAWGSRPSIIKSADKLMQLMENSPYDFIMSASEKQLDSLQAFYHRTFNGTDTVAFAKALRALYKKTNIEKIFEKQTEDEPLIERMDRFRNIMIQNMPERTKKHVANIKKGSAAKKLNLFLRWLVRPSTGGVDLGIWKTVSPAELFLPLDLHTARISRRLGILTRKQNDLKAVQEVTTVLRQLCPEDPVKYDFALFTVDV